MKEKECYECHAWTVFHAMFWKVVFPTVSSGKISMFAGNSEIFAQQFLNHWGNANEWSSVYWDEVRDDLEYVFFVTSWFKNAPMLTF